jgi:magnesium chelatase family protein
VYAIWRIDGVGRQPKNRPVHARVFSATLSGIEAALVRVEVDVAPGIPAFHTVGLPDSAVRESRERVRAAIRNADFPFPQDRITVNLAPAALRKEGASFDLPIALGILGATGRLKPETARALVVVGELALDGQIRAVRGALAVGRTCRRRGFKTLLVPRANAGEAAAVAGLRIIPADTLRGAVAILNGEVAIPGPGAAEAAEIPTSPDDFGDVIGQAHAKRALEIAAAGSHNLLLVGPPGAGKTMLAQRLPSILPPMSPDEVIETSTIWSVAGLLSDRFHLLRQRPFRAPHHTISLAGLMGGGTSPHPGEVTLAHLGVLFMDELPEFQRHVLESLRQPLEEGRITITRTGGRGHFPARFQLVGAANPCRRGCPAIDQCLCTPAERQRYLGRLSRPLLDRIDLHVELPALTPAALQAPAYGESSGIIRARVVRARERQRERLAPFHIRANAELTPRLLRRLCPLGPDAQRLLAAAAERLGFSARGHDRTIKVARTIADLDGAEAIAAEHCAEAIQYRGLDRAWRG